MGSTTDFDSCACYNTRKAARLLAQAYDRALEPSGLNNTKFSTLASIRGAEGGLTITELATRLDVDRTTLTRNLTLLSRDGLVHITSGGDARSKRIVLTAAGEDAVAAAAPHWRRVQRSITARLGDWSRLQRQLARLATAARESR